MSSLEQFKIMQMVARGGTAILYKAIQTSLDRTVAVKKLHQHLTDDENFTRRFILEAKAAASLDHENIVHVIDFGKADGDYQIIMEYVDGRSLKDILKEKKRLGCVMALAIAYQICLGLEHAHAKGIVHRDIKPGNILIAHYGRVKITDFGLAKLTQAPTNMTAEESLLGTPLYMSPEQAYGESVDARSDLFSLGTVLYEMITGTQPFFSENCMGVINNIINCSVPPPSSLDGAIPDDVEEIVMKALSKNREGRFRNANEFRTAIEQYVGVVQLKEAEAQLPGLLADNTQTMILADTPVPSKKARSRRARPLAAVLGVLLAVLAVAAVFHIDMVSRSIGRLLHPGEGARPAAIEIDEGSFAVIPAPPSIDGPARGLSPGGASSVQDAGDSVAQDGGNSIGEDDVIASGENNERNGTQDGGAAPGADSVLVAGRALPGGLSSSAAQAAASPDSALRASGGGKPKGGADAPARDGAVSAAVKDQDVRKSGKEGWIMISSEPPAEVHIDGSYRTDTPSSSPIPLPAGMHTIECRNPLYETYHEQIFITAGELSRRTIVLKKLMGRIQLFTEPGAEFYLDGKLRGITPLQEAIEVAAGKHDLLIRKSGYNDWHSEVTIDADQTMPLRIRLSPSF